MRFCRTLVSIVLFSSLAVASQKNEIPPVPSTPKQPVVDEYQLINFSNAGHGGIGSAEDQRTAMDTYLYEFMYDQLGVKWASTAPASK